MQLSNRFGEKAEDSIPVQDLPVPDLGRAVDVDRHENFSLFVPKHRRSAAKLVEIFMGMFTTKLLLEVINPFILN